MRTFHFIDLNLGFEWADLALIFMVGLLTILLSTIYPAVVMSSFKPIQIVRGRTQIGSSGKMIFRKILLLVQFSLVQLFVIGAIIVAVQMNHFRKSDLGFSTEAVVITPTPNVDKLNVFRNSLLQDNRISKVAFGSGPPMAVDGLSLGTTFRLPQQGAEEGQEAEMKIGDPNYLAFYDLKLIVGRTFTENKKSFDEFIVNETLLKSLGWTPEAAIGKKLSINEGEATIVGVVEDFHNNSLQYDITPCVLMNWSYFQDKAFY